MSNLKTLNPDKVDIIYNATGKVVSAKEIAAITKMPYSTCRLYCIKMAEYGMLTEETQARPALYQRIPKKDWPITQRENVILKAKQESRDNVETLRKLLSQDKEPESTELVKLTYRLMRELNSRDKILAMSVFYRELSIALKDIAEE